VGACTVVHPPTPGHLTHTIHVPTEKHHVGVPRSRPVSGYDKKSRTRKMPRQGTSADVDGNSIAGRNGGKMVFTIAQTLDLVTTIMAPE
jgi:hypothetical protein